MDKQATKKDREFLKGAWAALILGLICEAIGLFVLAKLVSAYYLSEQSYTWPSVEGTVISASIEKLSTYGRGSDTHEAVIYYRYDIEGKEFVNNRIRFGYLHDIKFEAEILIAKYPADSLVTVYYDPKSPGRSTLETSYKPDIRWICCSAPLFCTAGLLLTWMSLVDIRKDCASRKQLSGEQPTD